MFRENLIDGKFRIEKILSLNEKKCFFPLESEKDCHCSLSITEHLLAPQGPLMIHLRSSALTNKYSRVNNVLTLKNIKTVMTFVYHFTAYRGYPVCSVT